MRLVKLVRTAAGRLAAVVGAVRISDASSDLSLPIYDPSEDAFVPGKPDSVVRIPGFFGDGKDGAVHYTTNTTLAQDVRAVTVLVDQGVVVNQNGFEISANFSIVNNGTIHDNGADAFGGARGEQRSLLNSCGLAGGQGGFPGVIGNPSRSLFVETAGSGYYFTSESLGASGGDGGGPSGGGGGDNSTSWASSTIGSGPFVGLDPTSCTFLFDPTALDSPAAGIGSLSLGAGGGGGTDPDGGGGGAGGGIVRLRSLRFTNNGLISARGGNGGNAVAGNSGGGGGGGGGRIVIVSSQLVQGTLSVSGGIGGSGLGTGTSGASGQSGTIHIFGNN